jgi:hypothetical protein
VTGALRALASGAAFAICGCAAEPVAPGAPRAVSSMPLAPYAEHRECVNLAPGDRLEYRFESSEPVAFNIHYRDANLTVMPISRSNVIEDSGVYSPIAANAYCLTWEAGSAGAMLGYRMALRRAAR